MILKGLKAINEALFADELAQQQEWDKRNTEYLDAYLKDTDDTERFIGYAADDDTFLIYHVKNKKVVALAGIDQTRYKAWRDVPGYCEQNGLDYDALYEASKH